MIKMTKINEYVLQTLSYGVYIISSCFNGKLNAQLANIVFQVTAEPERIAVGIHKDNLTHEYIGKSGVLAVSVISESAPMNYILPFGFKSGRDVNKLVNISFKIGTTGCPILTEHTLSAIEAKVTKKLDIGTHTLFIANIIDTISLGKGTPLTYLEYHNRKGKTPKNAPTYRHAKTIS